MTGNAFEQFEKASRFVIESAEHYVFDTGFCEPDDGFDRGRGERGIDDDGERWELSAYFLERLDLDRAAGAGIGDDDVGDEVFDRSVELTPGEDRGERVL